MPQHHRCTRFYASSNSLFFVVPQSSCLLPVIHVALSQSHPLSNHSSSSSSSPACIYRNLMSCHCRCLRVSPMLRGTAALFSTYALVYPVPNAVCGCVESTAICQSCASPLRLPHILTYISVAKAPTKMVLKKTKFRLITAL